MTKNPMTPDGCLMLQSSSTVEQQQKLASMRIRMGTEVAGRGLSHAGVMNMPNHSKRLDAEGAAALSAAMPHLQPKQTLVHLAGLLGWSNKVTFVDAVARDSLELRLRLCGFFWPCCRLLLLLSAGRLHEQLIKRLVPVHEECSIRPPAAPASSLMLRPPDPSMTFGMPSTSGHVPLSSLGRDRRGIVTLTPFPARLSPSSTPRHQLFCA
mmetsp:Transcript_115201/g.336838  ORF Transcript_115201/g.336838 Transcript_115201/m.336838 type:complete len:210 (+) Transcript_115201:203-832(+)